MAISFPSHPMYCMKMKYNRLVLQYPLEQIMIETDGPWRFEGPFSGQMTHPRMMRESIKKIAEIKQISIKEVEDTLYENTKKFYQIRLSIINL